ncbi:MAG: hypothetical protein HY781_10520 [Chloroflexi bacterium]|nr:hypothetical protein [Chloroflexota bacterium]
MPDLLQSLHKHDIGYLRIIASLWGVELTAPETEAAARQLAGVLLDPELVGEIVDSLPAEARSALDALAGMGGKMPWAAFTRQFGKIRDAGPGRRDREQVYLNPSSAAEVLFYRALVARAFFDTPNGLQEFAYLPDDLLLIIHHGEHRETGEKSGKGSVDPVLSLVKKVPLGHLATPKEREHSLPASDRLLDDATTLLAALRMNLVPPETGVPVDVVSGLLRAAGILAGNEPHAERVRSFLEISRPQALSMLADAWRSSETFNELRLIPGLACEGEWKNAPFATRHYLLGLLEAVPEGKWWSLPAFIRAVKEKSPDFQRPAGDYDSWFIKRVADGVYLRGFSSWDEVDGALIRYLITGPLFWLGSYLITGPLFWQGNVDVASAEEGGIVTAFRIKEKRITSNESAKLTVASNGRITVPRLVPRVARYLISRFCEWEEGGRVAADHQRRIAKSPKGEAKPDEYHYLVTTTSLNRAGAQGLKVNQLLSLLAKNAAAEIPPVFVKSLKRWERNGTEARVETQVVLRVSRPEVLEELRKSKAGRFLGESLGPVTVVVKPGAQSKVLAALAELGLLADEIHEE